MWQLLTTILRASWRLEAGVGDEDDALVRGGPGLLDVGQRDRMRVDVEGPVGDLLREGGQLGEDLAGADGTLAAADDLGACRAQRGRRDRGGRSRDRADLDPGQRLG